MLLARVMKSRLLVFFFKEFLLLYNLTEILFPGKGVANPTAMLLTTLNMLDHLGLQKEEELLRKAINRVLSEAKVKTRDLGGYATTQQFTNAVINSL